MLFLWTRKCPGRRYAESLAQAEEVPVTRSSTSEIYKFFTYIEVLKLLGGSISGVNCLKLHVDNQIINPNRKMVGIEN